MQITKALASPYRNPTIDVFRAIAIIAVVLYHFKYAFYMGYLGVDLFFVISGFLVGGLLIKNFKAGERIKFKRFFLRRGFKIWPSYYLFLLIGGIGGLVLFSTSNPSLMPHSWWKYILFYQNYELGDNEWIYSHAWSLCVEEHFYILLPIILILNQKYGSLRSLILSICALILIGEASKIVTYLYAQDKDTYFTTHNRIDALAWGVLLQLFISYSNWIKTYRLKVLTFIMAACVFLILFKLYFISPDFFRKAVFRSIIPPLFAVMIGALYYGDLSFLRPLRVLGYYSYNWYLWHPIIAFAVIKYIGTGVVALSFYLIASFAVGVLFTVLIEEPFLKWRNRELKNSRP